MIANPIKRFSVSEQNFGRLIAFLVGLGFLALIVAGSASIWLQLRNQDHVRWVEHTYDAQARLDTLATLNERVETARRGYLITGDTSFRDIFDQTDAAIPQAIRLVASSVGDNPRQRALLAKLEPIAGEQRKLQRHSMNLVRQGRRPEAMEYFRTDRSVILTRQIRAIIETMQKEEARLLEQRNAEQERSLLIFYVVLGITALLVLLVAMLSVAVIIRYSQDLARSRNQLRALNENLEDAVRERTTDLQRANDEIQRFAYIVSHDLRSPLVNVMGFTSELDASRKPLIELVDRLEAEQPELLTSAAALAVREDLPEAIGFIRTSTQKMDRLINAILRLSREGRRTITAERVDVEALLQSIADSLQHRVSELGAEVVIERPLPWVVSDRLALEQIFSNLIENGVKYLQPGRPGIIRVRGRRERDRILYEIEDNGRGIDPRDHERIFDLFRRSGSQDQPGEGIGLAHVRALAYRLGGIIDVQSELDRGATFRLSLPVDLKRANDLPLGARDNQ